MIVHGGNNLSFNITQDNPSYYTATVNVTHKCVDALYKEALMAQKSEAHTYGFPKGLTPMYYIENNFRPHILEHLKELLFTHFVMGFLCQSLYQNKIVFAGEPQLIDIKLEPNKDAQFIFLLTHIAPEKEERWKKLNLRAPERKNYKDLDRQVESFTKEEIEKMHGYKDDRISFGDWVCFEMHISDNKNHPLLDTHKDQLWVKINDEETDLAIHELFLGRKKGDCFTTQSSFLQDYVSNKLDMNYNFGVHIKDFVPYSFFSFDQFKRHFQLKTAKELHQKLIEVFSYRNDISQRRETIEATFKLVSKQYLISLPKSLLEKQREIVLDKVQTNPDYHVYKAQNDFKEKIKQLAEKQLKEAIIIDTISYQENMQINHDDLLSYLNLVKRPRTKEFVYFDMPSTRIRGAEVPLATEVLKQYCLREKTLNHVIYQLTKKS